MNRVKAGFFSLSHHATTGDDRPYLDWHQLDHMPEQYQLPGLVLGQRGAATRACRAARLAGDEGWAQVEHVVLYLMGNPLDETVDEFLALGRHLAELGRFSQSLPSHYRGALRLLEAQAAPRALISSEVVPWRPHRGVYFLVEALGDGTGQDDFLQRMHTELLPELVGVDGVAGAWSYSTTPSIRRPMFTDGRFRMTVCYLDGEPAVVGERLAEVVERGWAEAPSQLVLAAPYESMMRWEWDRFGPDA